MIADVVIADGKLHSKMQVRYRDRFAIKCSENNVENVIGALDPNPHPFDFAGGLVPKFGFDIVTGLVHGLIFPSPHYLAIRGEFDL